MKIISLKYFTFFIIFQNFIHAHCQVPCGIYNDAIRIQQIIENFETIEKSMDQIRSLSKNIDIQSTNQLNRWILTKEKHAGDIQIIIAEYFLTQRIKENDSDYIKKLTFLQKILVTAMKCKQTVDSKYVKSGNDLIKSFSEIYLDNHGKKYLDQLSG
jgi:Nickel-containing superoxide dismutase.